MNTLKDKTDKAIAWLKSAQSLGYIGEDVSQLDHALQCAYFAEQAGHDEDVILASLFHDIGHFASKTQQYNMAHLGIVNHEWIGSKLTFDLGFSVKMALLIGYHVEAKRYLAGKKSHYYDRLSEASKGTLAFQGGFMSLQEQLIFESHPCFKAILQVRTNDEKAKVKGLKVPDVEYYRPLIQANIQKNNLFSHDLKLTDYLDTAWVKQFKTSLELNLEHVD